MIQGPPEAAQIERTHLRVYADDGNQRFNDILVPLQKGMPVINAAQLNRKDLRNSVMYFAMVDRFMNGDTANDRPTADPSIQPKANNLGGDLQGITKKIKDGYFAQLGVNTIWISPITTNAEGAWGLWNKGVESKFSAYHGYWPTALRSIDNRFGNAGAMNELLQTAHANQMNVILDYVAHHVHQDHPLYKQKPEWTTPLYLPDGTMNTEKWDEHRLTTWFDTFLPTWDFANHTVVEALTDTAMYWVENYDLDGFRHDATKHINEDFWRTLTKKVKNYQRQHPGRNIFQIGETYGNPELISSYISSGQLDAQFDFNLYDAAVDAFAKSETNFSNLERVLKESMSYYGSHHLMGNITGNQDRARFISYADGSVQFSEDAKLAGWTRDIQNKGSEGYKRMAMLMAFLMTTPGVPCVYYGDEIGMPGGNDPDNRRMMNLTDWNADQEALKAAT
ncbi:MAG: alpha-amylase family glycosyl hydrolase, partial [Flavobacteriales bacterium]